MKKETFKAYIDAERAQFVKEIRKYPVDQYLSLRTAVDDFLIAFDQLRDKLLDHEKLKAEKKPTPNQLRDKLLDHEKLKAEKKPTPKIVKSPITNSAFEKDKEYEVVDTWGEFSATFGHRIIIYDDNGERCKCLSNRCSYIGEGNWIIVK